MHYVTTLLFNDAFMDSHAKGMISHTMINLNSLKKIVTSYIDFFIGKHEWGVQKPVTY